jgi:hypothetical protein
MVYGPGICALMKVRLAALLALQARWSSFAVVFAAFYATLRSVKCFFSPATFSRKRAAHLSHAPEPLGHSVVRARRLVHGLERSEADALVTGPDLRVLLYPSSKDVVAT